MPMIANQVLTDDERFLLIYNFNPAQSVTVVDTKLRKFVREIETPGCALIYPTGPRSFFSVCGDGSLSLVELDDAGTARQKRTQPLFNLAEDPVTEKAVRIGGTWYFVSFAGRIYPLQAQAQAASLGPTWWLTSDAERKAGWRPGGLQQLAVNPQKSRLYAIMHRGGVETHKDPGKDVWVFDVSTRQRVQQFALKNLATSIQLSSDAQPLLYSISLDRTDLDIYDAASGKLLRSVDHVGTTPTVMVTPYSVPSPMLDPAFGYLIILGIALLFASAAAQKLRSPAHFAEIFAGYRLLPDTEARRLAWLIPCIELAVAAAALSCWEPGRRLAVDLRRRGLARLCVGLGRESVSRQARS